MPPENKPKTGTEPAVKKELPGYVMDNLYRVQHYLSKQTRKRVGLTIEVPVFIKDPLVALEDPALGVQEISVRREAGMGSGPTSSRVVVVDFNADMQTLHAPVVWDDDAGWFRQSAATDDGDGEKPGALLPKAPPNNSKKKDVYKIFVESTVKDPYFHQVNVWAVVQRVLEFYEDPYALGRPVPWGFDGNRLIVVPHAGYGENAFYDQKSKSLQFYYFGDQVSPGYTCLSHDIIAHETGHAILDGVRPMYNQLCSVQTAAFHEFIGDLTAILLALFNQDIRQFVSQTTEGRLGEANVLANIAKEFAKEVEGRDYLRTAFNKLSMQDPKVRESLSPHFVSQVLTGAMWDILTAIATRHLEKNLKQKKTSEMPGAVEGGAVPADGDAPDTGGGVEEPAVTPAKALWWAADRFRRVALQPLDLCPPCDIQFLDYARAVILNDILTNPVDEQGYRPAMLKIFHQRGLCDCGYRKDRDLPAECKFRQAVKPEKMDFIYHDISRIARSRTAAYYFLSDNRQPLRIPPHQDVRVVDLYDNSKFGAAAEKLPREVVLEYAWQEVILLENDAEHGLDFGGWEGKTYNLDCGGTLVFDDHGNLLSWFRKPGTEHISEETVQDIRRRVETYKADPKALKRTDVPTKLERAILEDYEEGQARKAAVRQYLADLIRRGLMGPPAPGNRFQESTRPVTAWVEDGTLHLESTPHLRASDWEMEAEGWTVNY